MDRPTAPGRSRLLDRLVEVALGDWTLPGAPSGHRAFRTRGLALVVVEEVDDVTLTED